MMRVIRHSLAIAALLVSTFTFLSCFTALDPSAMQGDANRATGSISISLGEGRADARTVTADLSLNVSEWTIVLTPAEGPSKTITSAVPSLTVRGLVPGLWNIAVTGRDAAMNELFSGSVPGVVITASNTVPVIVPLSSIAGGNGMLHLTVTVPYSTNITSATVNLGSVTPNAFVEPQPRTFVIEASLPSGPHTLIFKLFRGTTPAGTFVEAVNIYSGVISDRWITPSGAMSPVLALGWSDLVSTDRQLSRIDLPAGAFFDGAGFVPSDLFQTVLTEGSPSVVLTPIEAVNGQTLAYSNTSAIGPWDHPILSGATVTINVGETIWFRVISPNGDAGWTNVYTIDAVNDCLVRYHSNGEVITDEAVFGERFVTPPYTVRIYGSTAMDVETIAGAPGTFICWNTARDGSGIAYPEGAMLTSSAHTELYAQWQSAAEFNALVADFADGSVDLPASFTENDLYAVAALIQSSAVPVTLDMSHAAGITEIPASVFNGCAQLVAVHVSDSITSIGSQAFAGTGMVTSGTAPFDFICDATTPPALSPDAFGNPAFVPASFKILVPAVPAGTEALYEAAPGWSAFAIHIDPH